MGVRATAAEIGISPTTLSRIERGHIPDVGTLEKVSAWLGEEAEKFVGVAGLQIIFKKKTAMHRQTAQSLARLIEEASKQFAKDTDSESA